MSMSTYKPITTNSGMGGFNPFFMFDPWMASLSMQQQQQTAQLQAGLTHLSEQVKEVADTNENIDKKLASQLEATNAVISSLTTQGEVLERLLRNSNRQQQQPNHHKPTP